MKSDAPEDAPEKPITLSIRLRPSEKAALMAAARERCLSMSAVLRELVQDWKAK
jgi:hypothetical protein